jgi:hypothetical protein
MTQTRATQSTVAPSFGGDYSFSVAPDVLSSNAAQEAKRRLVPIAG